MINKSKNFPSFKGELTFQDILISCSIRTKNFKTWGSYVSLAAQIPTRLDTVPFLFIRLVFFFFEKNCPKIAWCVSPHLVSEMLDPPLSTHLEVVWGRQVWVRRREVRAPRK